MDIITGPEMTQNFITNHFNLREGAVGEEGKVSVNRKKGWKKK